jgi:hypothetical protein
LAEVAIALMAEVTLEEPELEHETSAVPAGPATWSGIDSEDVPPVAGSRTVADCLFAPRVSVHVTLEPPGPVALGLAMAR